MFRLIILAINDEIETGHPLVPKITAGSNLLLPNQMFQCLQERKA
jgi:hypothetical protein